MTSRYRVEYALKTHRRDELIEWMKGLTAVPFVLNAGAGSEFRVGDEERSVSECRRKYGEIFADVEKLIAAEHDAQQQNQSGRLRRLVPTIGHFFTKLPLERAFYALDAKRAISRRRLVAPSFNDHRLILNCAQAMALSQQSQRVKLVTFDGDLTLYEDGQALGPDDAVISRLLALLKQDIAVGIVTAAGYSDIEGTMYYERLRGLVDAVKTSSLLSYQKERLLVMGGECNYMFRYCSIEDKLTYVPESEWLLPEQASWTAELKQEFLDHAQQVLEREKRDLGLDMARVIRKECAVGLVPTPNCRIPREALEEVVLMCQHILAAKYDGNLHFTAFNGGADVWCDIGDKRYGVLCLQKFLGGIPPTQTLHIGDQFAPLGANDYKARLAGCTVWICNPRETVSFLDDLILFLRP